MTCREFKHSAASLTLWELSRLPNEQILNHAGQCSKCGAWLDRQHVLAAGMQTLQARTAGRQGGPQVERALLRMFRQVPFEATQRVAAHRSAPIAFRLSRFFEVGAYVAVAAAIVVGLFLGAKLLEERSVKHPAAQSQSSPAVTPPAQQVQTAENVAPKAVEPTMHGPHAAPGKRELPSQLAARSETSRLRTAVADVSQTNDDPEYVALMFCDPLSCSTDAQVVRMELPGAGATSDQDAQPLVADVVVGYDGVVRAMRIVN